MNIWRLIAHHEHPAQMAEWSRRQGVIAIGWGGTNDLSKQRFSSEAELKRLVIETHLCSSISNCVNGGCSLWRLYTEMKKGDLVIVSASGRRALTMRVNGDYYFAGGDASHSYEHRRRAKVVQVDPNWLWNFSGGLAPGENIRRALVRCARPVTEAEFKAFAG